MRPFFVCIMDFIDFAKTPPMGWNSWDCFGAGVTEAQLIENADFMAEHLRKYGWEYIVCDIQWYEPKAVGNDYNDFADLIMDENGRLLPAENRFPSAVLPKKYYYGCELCGAQAEAITGFKRIADYVHSKGLKFGIHMMRGIPRQAVALDLPIKNSGFSARDVAHHFSVCSWNTDMYGLKNCRGAQDYYDSVISMYADWGVDFIKCDDIAVTEFSKYDRPYSAYYEVEMIRKAIDRTGREIVLSLSPGPARVSDAPHLRANSNMWRITGDFWDSWDMLADMFDKCKAWDGSRGIGSYPDCDMLPLGVISKNSQSQGTQNRKTRFTADECLTMLSLWGLCSSPLMIGGNLPELESETISWLTNEGYIRMVKTAHDSTELLRNDQLLIRKADGENDREYFGFFNISDNEATVDIDKHLDGSKTVFDIWEKTVVKERKTVIAPHGVKLLEI